MAAENSTSEFSYSQQEETKHEHGLSSFPISTQKFDDGNAAPKGMNCIKARYSDIVEVRINYLIALFQALSPLHLAIKLDVEDIPMSRRKSSRASDSNPTSSQYETASYYDITIGQAAEYGDTCSEHRLI
ncbi:hypothetical protein TESG_00816 [Trichophyton tonsurans CBS 112818]|uniref:Uncharacterized protein n=2 Tax=Trichophyton TaxID=5550 RepID=F2Q049_TRIEC|nr:hypothetical protein TESG_00816 [Trichophyton tonsurans CBS 112818]EGE07517.1 hypothetical protein TEQG_06430 [Trichophyton equinum CBS 127.97]